MHVFGHKRSSGCFSEVLFGFFLMDEENCIPYLILIGNFVLNAPLRLFFRSWRNVIACCAVELILIFIQQIGTLMTQQALALLFKESK